MIVTKPLMTQEAGMSRRKIRDVCQPLSTPEILRSKVASQSAGKMIVAPGLVDLILFLRLLPF